MLPVTRFINNKLFLIPPFVPRPLLFLYFIKLALIKRKEDNMKEDSYIFNVGVAIMIPSGIKRYDFQK